MKMKNTSAVKGYKIDFTTNTMIVNYTFNDASKVYGSPEYKLLKNVIADFPDIKIAVKSGREKKSPNKNKRLTYENMLKYISVCENAEEMLNAFESTRIRSQLEKLGSTSLCYESLTVDVDDGLYIPIKEINLVRRIVCEEIEGVISCNSRIYSGETFSMPKSLARKKSDRYSFLPNNRQIHQIRVSCRAEQNAYLLCRQLPLCNFSYSTD
jgi:hypothetical protein